ncbi:MAG: hypothetical protein AB8C13_01050 [Phycisphaerales bacterium]
MNKLSSPFVVVWVTLLLSVVLWGCGSEGVVGDQVDVELFSEIMEPRTGASLKLSVNSYEIETTEQLIVRAQTRWVSGVEIELIEPAWAESGWTLRERVENEVVFDGSGYSKAVEYVLDPYLSGSYILPSFGVRASNLEHGKRIARLNEIPVRVLSVLEEDDSSVLAAPVGFAALPLEADDHSRQRIALIFFGAGLCMLGITALLYYFRADEGGHESLEPRVVIGAIANSDQISEADAGAFHRAVEDLLCAGDDRSIDDATGLDTGLSGSEIDREVLKSISKDIEGIRFSGSGLDADRVRAAAQRVRGMLEAGS